MSGSDDAGHPVFGDRVQGDSINVGQGIGKAVGYGGTIQGVVNTSPTTALEDALRELAGAVESLRDRIADQDQEILDESLTVIRNGDGRPGALRRALYSIAGLAAVVSDVGTPIIEAVRQLTGAIGS